MLRRRAMMGQSSGMSYGGIPCFIDNAVYQVGSIGVEGLDSVRGSMNNYVVNNDMFILPPIPVDKSVNTYDYGHSGPVYDVIRYAGKMFSSNPITGVNSNDWFSLYCNYHIKSGVMSDAKQYNWIVFGINKQNAAYWYLKEHGTDKYIVKGNMVV